MIAAATLDVRTGTPPIVFTGSDGQKHLAYELQIADIAGTSSARLERIDVVGERNAKPLISYTGDDLGERVMRPGAERAVRYGPVVPSGTTAVVHFWVTIPRGQAVPRYLRHSFVALAADGTEVSVDNVRVDVQPGAPLVLGAPLRGGTWWAHNGPGNHRSPHWGSALVQNGRATIPQRFAIDFIGLDTNGRAVRGDVRKSSNEDWIGFGAEVLAVADGVIREMRDGISDNPPLFEPPSPPAPTLTAVGGNYVVLELAANRFVHYIHLQSGSVSVKVGQRIRRGQVLGRVGNSGNTNGAHLHFNVVDAASFEGAEGLPFVFDAFDRLGETTAARAIGEEPRPPFAQSPPSRRRHEIPLDGAIVRFP